MAVLGEEICSQQTVEINEDHDVHEHHRRQEIPSKDQLREVHEDVPCQVGLRSQTKADVGCDVDKLINGVEE